MHQREVSAQVCSPLCMHGTNSINSTSVSSRRLQSPSASSPPTPRSHSSHPWKSSSKGNPRPSFVYLLLTIVKVTLWFYVRVCTRKAGLYVSPTRRKCKNRRRGPLLAVIVTLGDQAIEETSAQALNAFFMTYLMR